MELGMREWFLVIGGLMITGVLAHGAWVVFKARRDAIGFKYERNIPDIDVDDIDLLRGELPTGGARVVTADAAEDDLAARQADLEAEAMDDDAGSPPLVPTPATNMRSLDLDEQVPVLMDPIDQDLARDAAATAATEPVAPEPAAPEPAAPEQAAPGQAAPEPAAAEPEAVEDDGGDVGADDGADDGAAESDADELAAAADDFEQAPLFAGEPIVPREDARQAGSRRGRGQRKAGDAASRESGDGSRRRKRATAEADGAEPLGPPEDVIVINVLCRNGNHADGPALLETITDHGLRFGDMNIFHRHSPDDRGRIDFSVASAVEPGTFDLGAAEEFETPGITMFMQLPGPANPLEAFEDMVSIARGIASQIGADLRDEQHSVMTAQTIEHCRQRIREFARRQMSKRA